MDSWWFNKIADKITSTSKKCYKMIQKNCTKNRWQWNRTTKWKNISPEKKTITYWWIKISIIIMEYQKIINLLDNTSNKLSKFRTKNWIEINYQSRGVYI